MTEKTKERMIREKVRKALFEAQDEAYQSFHAKLIPTVNPKTIIGVRAPQMKALAKEIASWEGSDLFLQDLPHAYFDENALHMRMISNLKDYDLCMDHIRAFLPYVDNWAVCDVPLPKVFKKQKQRTKDFAMECIAAQRPYSVRYGVNILMGMFLDEDFDESHLEAISGITEEDYYVKMGVAWYFATALAKQYEATIPYVEQHRLEEWIHKKTIQKAVESYRISEEKKVYLRTLK